MRKKSRILFSIILIIISLVLLFCGIFFSRRDLITDNVSISTDLNVHKPSRDISITVNDSLSKNSSSNKDTLNISTNDLSIEQVNDNLRHSIENKYGITIKYGEEISGYSIGNLDTTMISDSNQLNSALSSLNYMMSLYPSGMFKEFNRKSLSLTIYLIDKYSNDKVTGVTDSRQNNVIMSLSIVNSFSESFNHEMYHYIDAFIEKSGGNYSSWNSYNPNNFRYGNVNPDIVYSKTGLDDSYFVNTYAQLNENEDRASTFEYMMSSNKVGCLNYGKTIYLKAKYISNQIDFYFDTVNSITVEYWERYL